MINIRTSEFSKLLVTLTVNKIEGDNAIETRDILVSPLHLIQQSIIWHRILYPSECGFVEEKPSLSLENDVSVILYLIGVLHGDVKKLSLEQAIEISFLLNIYGSDDLISRFNNINLIKNKIMELPTEENYRDWMIQNIDMERWNQVSLSPTDNYCFLVCKYPMRDSIQYKMFLINSKLDKAIHLLASTDVTREVGCMYKSSSQGFRFVYSNCTIKEHIKRKYIENSDDVHFIHDPSRLISTFKELRKRYTDVSVLDLIDKVIALQE